MSIEADLTTFVCAGTSINAVIADRMYPVFSKKDTTAPYIVYRRLSTDRLHTHSGTELRATVRFLLTCWAETFDAAIALGNLVRSRVDGVKSTWTSSTVHRCFLVDESDNFEPSPELLEKQYYGRDLTIELNFTES